MHISAKLYLGYSKINVVDYYENIIAKGKTCFALYNIFLGFSSKDFNIFRYKVLIFIITILYTYLTNQIQ